MSAIEALTLQLPIVGHVTAKNVETQSFVVKTRGGTEFVVRIRPATWYDAVTNLDRLGRHRQPLSRQPAVPADRAPSILERDINVGDLIAVEGMCHIHDQRRRYDALAVHLLKSHKGHYHFEHTFWWKGQIEAMANKWLDVLFGDKRTYDLDDFSAMYRTTLSIEGAPTDDATQEMATLSRLIYGLSSAYLLGGDERYFLAARAGVRYQREAFRSYSTDGRFCLWLHARKRDRHGTFDLLPSQFGDDAGTLPLYEQIYALAGLAQYYRITNDPETLMDIRRTLNAFDAMFADRRTDQAGGRWHDGFFSHIDPVTFRWDSPELDSTGNRACKNWNSIGDHLPAYLINLVLALDPLPKTEDGSPVADPKQLQQVLEFAVEILEVTAGLIHKKFRQDPPYVQERFTRDWDPVKDWAWQQNRAIVGHNLKIAWNLTRVANYYRAKGNLGRAEELFEFCREIGTAMASLGIDQVRSGVYDALERQPDSDGIPIQFAWFNTKDFWQQEQGILAYLIMGGYLRAKGDHDEAEKFWEIARELSTVWNVYFLDRERNGIFFRVSDNGIPVLSSTYGDKGGHSISGYHAFELDYLAHIYQLVYLPRAQQAHTTFCLHFRPDSASGLRSINVLPDFLGDQAVEIARIEVDGVERPIDGITDFQVPLLPEDRGRHVMVALRQSAKAYDRMKAHAIVDDALPLSPLDVGWRTTGLTEQQ
jgi:mannose/cellobiose epimerase-like protein (N-acyl-D-glucosamine 2-epimerase family)